MTTNAFPPSAASAPPASRLAPGLQLGDYRLGAPLWPLRIADAYRATGPAGAATLYVIHPQIAQHAAVRDQIVAGTRVAAALPEHRHLVRTLAAGLTGDVLWIATEEVDGSLVRDLMAKKRQTGGAGLGARATGNLITGVANALAEVTHGALATESVAVNRTGRVRVIDLALGPGTLAAITAGLVPAPPSLAPEAMLNATAGAPPLAVSDVYAVGALLYETLVGAPLERGGPRPSDVVEGVNTQIDGVVARACHREPDMRFSRVDVLGEVVAEALQKGGALQTSALPTVATAPSLGDQQASLAQAIADAPRIAAASALSTALADPTEKWLISRDRMDYGPFSLAEVIAQIERGEIVAGNLIHDKDSGARADVGEHPLLAPILDAARQKLDDQRRAQAEVKEQKRDKKRGAMLYAMIGAGVVVAALIVVIILRSIEHDDSRKVAQQISTLDGASLHVTVSQPKKPPPAHRAATGGKRPANSGNSLALDMADDNDDSEALDMGVVYGVYSRYGAKLGGCMQGAGEHHAAISIAIDGPSGRVTWAQVNDKQAGGLYSCLNGVLRGMQFPKIHGPRTRAEFDIAM